MQFHPQRYQQLRLLMSDTLPRTVEGRLKESVAKPIVLVHPTGNEFVRHALVGLDDAGLLGEFWTCISWNSKSILNEIMPESFAAELQRRSFPQVRSRIIRTRPFTEIMRLSLQRVTKRGIVKAISAQFSSDRVNQRLDQAVAGRLLRSGDVSGVYSYEDVALRSFLAAKRRQLTCVYDLPIGYWRAYHEIMREEAERLPEWTETLGGNRDSAEKLVKKDRELALADVIIVASSFTCDTLSLYPHKLTGEIVRIPYGAPAVSPPRRVTSLAEPLRILFVGSLGQRKGIAYLLEAVERLAYPYRLTLLGRPVSVPVALERALNRHHWIPSSPHAEVLKVMQEHDVLVFPSLFEGFGLVLLEAMSQGLAVITTAHTAGPDIITQGLEGFIVPIRSADAIAEALTALAEDRDRLAMMSRAAQIKSMACSWESYEQGIRKTVESTIAQAAMAKPSDQHTKYSDPLLNRLPADF
jgi:starch synthase